MVLFFVLVKYWLSWWNMKSCSFYIEKYMKNVKTVIILECDYYVIAYDLTFSR